MNFVIQFVVCLSLPLMICGKNKPTIDCNEPNTAYSSCSTKCVEKCPTYPGRSCTEHCETGCFCAKDFSRADNGSCIPTANCPVQCPSDQIYQGRCTDTCIEDRVRCGSINYACFCKPGLKRINDTCQPEANCYGCTENEEFSYRALPDGCKDKCAVDKESADCANLLHKGCMCKNNFRRSPKTQKCIPVQQCDE